MNWYVLQVLTGEEREVCRKLVRAGLKGRAPAQRMQIRRRGQWQEEERLLLPGYVFLGAKYSAALFHAVYPIPGVIRWLGMEGGQPQALNEAEALRWRLDSQDTLEPSRVLFQPGGGWYVLDGPLAAFKDKVIRMDRRQRRAYVVTDLGGGLQRIRFSVTPVEGTL